ncbi:hypothetical protein F2Q70_00037953 [Brassica cretica]|uniref:Uncharacterized protein n=1 Tax=Brassica cretica TaxID=69181 RepID=A0A8S9K943_BRACR|nr:hypothetical protein F2Q70_00037953 [Brassica cretica]
MYYVSRESCDIRSQEMTLVCVAGWKAGSMRWIGDGAILSGKMRGGSSGRLDVYSGSLGSCRIHPGCLTSMDELENLRYTVLTEHIFWLVLRLAEWYIRLAPGSGVVSVPISVEPTNDCSNM